MNRILLTLLLITILINCNSVQNESSEKELKEFNTFLGEEKANTLNMMTQSFEKFLGLNFPEQKTEGEQILAFLNNLDSNLNPDTNWIINTADNLNILEQYETSGLRKEVYLFGYENYSPKYTLDNSENKVDSSNSLGILTLEIEDEELIPINQPDSINEIEYQKQIEVKEAELKKKRDNALWFNVQGQFLYGLDKYSTSPIVVDHVNAKKQAGNISLPIIIKSFLENYTPKEYENPLAKRILVVHIFKPIMAWDIKRKNKSTIRQQ